jgi:hypothetical protein
VYSEMIWLSYDFVPHLLNICHLHTIYVNVNYLQIDDCMEMCKCVYSFWTAAYMF